MTRVTIRKGDKVIIIAGKDRNKTGVIERVLPKTNRVVVTGLNLSKKHLKKTPKNPQGGIIDKEMALHRSNVMLLDPSKNKPTRVGFRASGSNKLRFAKLSNESTEKK